MDRKLEIGNHVVYVDEHRVRHDALVTIVWENMNPGGEPGCNLVHVCKDESRDDSYGRQIDRPTSIPHKSGQPAPGIYWTWPDEE
jgi:hypothetical protein